MNYYNEFDPFAAAWLKKLIEAGHIPQGYVDTRSIIEVEPDELKKYTQCHFFAGIGGWSYALQLARWPTDRPVWTGSCPCQPFSVAGQRKAQADERHLWPIWFDLIRECKPPILFGEQVSAAIAHGWLDEVAHDLESEGYAVGSAVLPACSVGAPHKRDRLFFVADTQYEQAYKKQQRPTKDERGWSPDDTSRRDLDCGQSDVGNTRHPRPHGGQVEGSNGQAIQHNPKGQDSAIQSKGTGSTVNVGNTGCLGQQGQRELGQPRSAETCCDGKASQPWDDCSGNWKGECSNVVDSQNIISNVGERGKYSVAGFPEQPIGGGCSVFRDVTGEGQSWRIGEWIDCPDGKQRLVEPSIRLLAHGVFNRVGKLRGYGNAIVPQVAAKFIEAYMEEC